MKGFSCLKQSYYWFRGEIPLGLILNQKNNKSFRVVGYSPYDLSIELVWILRYNSRKREFEIQKSPCN